MNKLHNDIHQRFHGFKPVKRGYQKQGQSAWYYIDPRYDGDNDKRGQIDVANENSPNPKLSDILAEDMRQNPQDYYIWRTKGDDKVRGAHAAREGKIFNKNIPPKGGNPGEDYNCRCWAEPYVPEKYSDKAMLVDVSGLEQYKTELYIKPNSDLSALPQYAENDKANTAMNATFRKNNTVLTEEKFRDIINFLRKKGIEGHENFPYLDSVGKDTICTGHLITEKERYSLPYYMADTGKPATQSEIKKEFDKLHKYTDYQKQAAENIKHNKNSKDRPYISDFFKDVTKLRLTDAQCDVIDRKIIEAKWNELVEKFPNFTIMDWNLQRAIFDVHYQSDVLKKKDPKDVNWNSKDEFKEYKWPRLLNAAKAKNIAKIAENVHVDDNNQLRNEEKIRFVLQGSFYE